MKNVEVLIVNESVSKAILRDGLTVFFAFLAIGPGIFLESAALQWVGFILFWIAIFNLAANLRKGMGFSIPEARAKLDEIEKDWDK